MPEPKLDQVMRIKIAGGTIIRRGDPWPDTVPIRVSTADVVAEYIVAERVKGRGLTEAELTAEDRALIAAAEYDANKDFLPARVDLIVPHFADEEEEEEEGEEGEASAAPTTQVVGGSDDQVVGYYIVGFFHAGSPEQKKEISLLRYYEAEVVEWADKVQDKGTLAPILQRVGIKILSDDEKAAVVKDLEAKAKAAEEQAGG